MILFPSAKINLGLRIIGKRNDGYHNIESFFYPIPLNDVIEFKKAPKFKLSLFGRHIPGKLSENILVKTWELMHMHYSIPPVEISLLKNIPPGSGLGGGSSDAVFFMKGLNNYFQLNITEKELSKLAIQLGSDCPFFVQNIPALVTGRGEIVQPVKLNLSGLYMILIIPEISLSTRDIFSKITQNTANTSIQEIIRMPVKSWHKLLTNDFEEVVFGNYPVLSKIKNKLISHGAIVASMTGTGSAVYGLFEAKPKTDPMYKYGETHCYKL